MSQDREICEVCGAPATVQRVTTDPPESHAFCETHRPRLAPGEELPPGTIENVRLPPGNAVSRKMMTPPDSVEHNTFRREMCNAQLLGPAGAARYYLGRLRAKDEFAVWSDEFVQHVREFLDAEKLGLTAPFFQTPAQCELLHLLLRRAWERVESAESDLRVSKEEQSMETLLHHPDWSDTQVAREVPTRLTQLGRWHQYVALRRIILEPQEMGDRKSFAIDLALEQQDPPVGRVRIWAGGGWFGEVLASMPLTSMMLGLRALARREPTLPCLYATAADAPSDEALLDAGYHWGAAFDRFPFGMCCIESQRLVRIVWFLHEPESTRFPDYPRGVQRAEIDYDIFDAVVGDFLHASGYYRNMWGPAEHDRERQ